MGKNSFDLNSGEIYGPQNRKSKYYNNDKTYSIFVISMTENTWVTIFMIFRGVELLHVRVSRTRKDRKESNEIKTMHKGDGH